MNGEKISQKTSFLISLKRNCSYCSATASYVDAPSRRDVKYDTSPARGAHLSHVDVAPVICMYPSNPPAASEAPPHSCQDRSAKYKQGSVQRPRVIPERPIRARASSRMRRSHSRLAGLRRESASTPFPARLFVPLLRGLRTRRSLFSVQGFGHHPAVVVLGHRLAVVMFARHPAVSSVRAPPRRSSVSAPSRRQ